jgi:hypothetical protein
MAILIQYLFFSHETISDWGFWICDWGLGMLLLQEFVKLRLDRAGLAARVPDD